MIRPSGIVIKHYRSQKLTFGCCCQRLRTTVMLLTMAGLLHELTSRLIVKQMSSQYTVNSLCADPPVCCKYAYTISVFCLSGPFIFWHKRRQFKVSIPVCSLPVRVRGHGYNLQESPATDQICVVWHIKPFVEA